MTCADRHAPPSCFTAAQSAAGFRILLLYPAAFLFCLERILLMSKVGVKTFENPALEILWHAQRIKKDDVQHRVLQAFYEKCGEDVYYGFLPITEHVKMDFKRVRVITRRLARKGLLEYRSGLFTEDGEVAGAGYTVTAKGRAVAQIINGDDSAVE